VSQEWAADTLHFPPEFTSPSLAPLVGSLVGLAGILLLAGPFVRETVSMQRATAPPAEEAALNVNAESAESHATPVLRALLEVAVVSILAVGILHFWNPLSFLHLYNGSYFASFVLISGVALLLIHYRAVRALFPINVKAVLLALFAGLLLHFLVSGWLDATFAEAWLSWSRWARVPVVFVAALVYLLAEELLLGPVGTGSRFTRVLLAMTLRLMAFLVLMFGIFVLHSGAVLLLLLAFYLALLFVFQRMGMDIVRRETGSAMAAAVFGAILLAGFCLVIFPVT
jgi:hypothetical protein